MLILFDHGTPAPIRSFLEGHTIKRTQDMGWDRLTNGELLAAGTDKNMRFQQDLTGRRLGVVVIGNAQWPVLRLHVHRVVEAVMRATAGSHTEVDVPAR